MTTQTLKSWQEIHSEILRRIKDRELRPGDAVPGEEQIAKEFGCSRTTVNRAMRELAAAGYLDRRRKAGTRVALHPVGRARLEIPVIRLEVEAGGSIWSHSLLKREMRRPTLAVAAKMRADSGSRMLFLRSLHFANAKPLLFEDRWINLSILPEARDIDFSAISANEWLVQNAAYTSGDMYFFAQNASPEHAEFLEMEPGRAILVAERITWSGGAAITAVRMHHAPDYRLRAAL